MKFPSLFFTILFGVAADHPVAAQSDADSSKLNRALQQELLRMGIEDQRHRDRMTTLAEQGLADPKILEEFIAITKAQSEIDQENLKKLEQIVQKHGWPGISMVGTEASNAAFLIVQHAELSDQKKYFPLLKEAMSRGEAKASEVAMLEDRILMREGKPQIFGTQLSTNAKTGKLELWPIANEEMVDERRASVGLPPLAEYLKVFRLEYTPIKQKK